MINAAPQLLLMGAVAAVGVLHTLVPDHWVPITLIARQQGWTKREVARAAFLAGTGHTVSTLIIGFLVWIAGVAFAVKFGNLVSLLSSIALIAFGGWIAVSSLRELTTGHGHTHSHGFDHTHDDDDDHDDDHHDHDHDHDEHEHDHQSAHGHDHDSKGSHDDSDSLYAPSRAGTTVLAKHRHAHRHGASPVHVHLHDHGVDSSHTLEAVDSANPPAHEHRHKRSLRTSLLLILGSSPMVEGIPAFFAAGKYGVGLISLMAIIFAISTIATYVVLCVSSLAGLQRVKLGAFERYGEVLSGLFIAAVGIVFLFFPLA